MFIWKIARTCTEVANLNFWCSSSFCVSSSGVTAQPHRRPSHTSQPIIGAFSCTCPLQAWVWICSSTPGREAIKADALLPLNSEKLKMLKEKHNFNYSTVSDERLEGNDNELGVRFCCVAKNSTQLTQLFNSIYFFPKYKARINQ